MFQDIGVSKNLIDQYGTYCESKKIEDTGRCFLSRHSTIFLQFDRVCRFFLVDFSIMVLSSNSWPFSAPPNFVLPLDLRTTFDAFTDFYTHQHNGRKLTWLHQHSKGDLQTLYTKQKYILHVKSMNFVVSLRI